MKFPTFALLLTGLALIDYTQAIIPAHLVKNYLAKKAEAESSADLFTSSVALSSLPCTVTISGVPVSSECAVTSDSATGTADLSGVPASTDAASSGIVISVGFPSTTLLAPTDTGSSGVATSTDTPLTGAPTGSTDFPASTDPASSDSSASTDFASTGSSASTDVPASTDPSSTDTSASTDNPTSTDAPSPTDSPSSTDSEASTNVPITTDSSAPTDSASTDVPASTDTSASTDVPVSTGISASTDDPASTDASASTDSLASTDAPAPTDTGSSDVPSATDSGITAAPSQIAPQPTESGSPPLTSGGSSSSSTLGFTSSSFVISDSITVPPQTAVETGTFETTTLTDHTGPPGSISATTTTDSDHHPIIFPVWFNSDGFPVIVIPGGDNGPPGIIPPPIGFPTIVIDPLGNPVSAPTSGPDPNPNPSPSPTPGPTPDPTASPSSTPDSTADSSDPTSSASDSSSAPTSTDATSQTSSSSSSSSSSSTAPTTAPSPFIIFPKDSASQDDKKSFESDLSSKFGVDSQIDSVIDAETGIFLWRTSLNSTQVDEIQAESIIDTVFPDAQLEAVGFEDVGGIGTSDVVDTPSTVKMAKRALTSQTKAPPELAILSEPLIGGIEDDYVFDDSAGSDITVFIVDTGANKDHPEFTGMPGTKKFLFGAGDTDEDDKQGHGSCVLSMATTPTFGAAKKANVIIVKVGFSTAGGGVSIGFFNLANAIQEVINEVVNNNQLKGKAVVNFSLGVDLDASQQSKVLSRLEKINSFDIPMFVASGNSARDAARKNVDRWPGLFKSNIPDGITVVGAVDNTGALAVFSQGGPLVTVWAPGVQVQCMPGSGTGAAVTNSGTSFASPKVAGLAAYLMALPSSNFPTGSVAKSVQAEIEKLAFPRIAGAAEKVAWNGINGNCGSSIKRDDGGACSISASASETSPPETSISASDSASPTAPSTTDSAPPTTLSTVTGSPSTSDAPSTTPQLSTSSSGPPPPSETIDLNNPDCVACSNDLGASNCAADDNNCLLQQCANDVHCQKCNIDCNTFVA